MGGNALKNISTRRYGRDEYFRLEAEVLNKFRTTFPKNRVEPIRAYGSKDSFGDMDLIFESKESVDWNLELGLMFNPKQIVKNGSVWSFEYKDFQIDLILTKPQEFNTSLFYFSYNDLNNLTGRVYHKMGFKFGHKGLTFSVKDGDYLFEEILVSSNPRMIYEFAEYNFTRYQHGFGGLEEIFNFVASSPYFNKDIYLLDNRNHTSRVRDKKRKTYNAFLNWCNDGRSFVNNYQWDSMEERGGRKETKEFMERAFQMFPDFKQQYQTAMEHFNKQRKFKELFNGSLVRELTWLQDQELGKFMKSFKEYAETIQWETSFEDWVLTNPELVNQFVKNYLELYNQTQ